MKEAAGAITGDERTRRPKAGPAEGGCSRTGSGVEGEDLPRAGHKAKEAEKERDRQERKDKGLLGDLGDTLSGL